jgi:pyruvate/2-oxoacid:ferredoxin oxidoreductase alpha subunit
VRRQIGVQARRPHHADYRPVVIDLHSHSGGRRRRHHRPQPRYGLGGRDITIEHIMSVYDDLAAIVKTGKVKNLVGYLNLREPE